MKIKRIVNFAPLLFLVAACCVQAEPLEQGGDIAKGAKFNVQPLDMISYYKDGKAGDVKFICILGGKGSNASLTPGKNFDGNTYHLLEEGKNGPYVWKLLDQGYNTGNIRVRLLKGSKATIQCKQTG